MSPIYEDAINTREKLWDLRKRNQCQQCGGMLNIFMDFARGKAFLACNDWPLTHHEGIAREALEYELNIPTRREEMVKELGEEKATKLEKYEGVVSLTRADAMEILQTIWPDAPRVEAVKAAIVCHQYGLNPLMKHVFLIPFKRRQKGIVVGEDWATVFGIKAKRLIAHRCGDFSYLDGSPRVMTDEEQERIFGQVDKTRVWAITRLKDSKGNTAPGYGNWPLGDQPYGVEKGNTKANMAFIRSESNALDRLFAGEMPQGIEVIDEQYDPPTSLISLSEGAEEIGKQPEGGGEGKPESSATISSAPKTETDKSKKIEVPAAHAEQQTFTIIPDWLSESLKEIKWTDDTAKTWLVSKYTISPVGTLEDVIKRLTKKQAEEFTQEIQNRAQKQIELF